MGNITNLATTGNYEFEKDNLKVSFNFIVDSLKKQITRIDSGSVIEEGTSIGGFNSDFRPIEEGSRLNLNLLRGREVELTIAITEAIASFEQQMAIGAL